MGSIKLKIKADNEHDYLRILARITTPYLATMMEAGEFETGPGTEPAPTPEPPQVEAQTPEPDPAHAKGKTGRPKGSSKKGNGAEPASPEPQTQAQTDAAASMLTLADQVQIITEAARLDRASFAPRLDELRKSLGLDLVAKSEEKHRPILQAFIDKHGLAV
jgi:hypothetical protein